MPLDPGRRLGRYEIVAPLGAGGMGEVYRARDPRLGRDVAVKIVADAGSGPPDRLQRFEREARAVAALSHPNVIAIFDVGVGDVPFLVTELLEGETLRAIVSRGPLDVRRMLSLALQLLAGLGAAHARGIAHRDLKPENVFVTTDDRVKLLDFGLADHVGIAGERTDLVTAAETAPGMVVGTLGYMAPEQLRGQAVDRRADIFACGALLFEMATGRKAFEAPTPADVVSAILTRPPRALAFEPGTPPGLAVVVRRCLEKDPASRYQCAADLASALEALSGVGVSPAARGTAPIASAHASIAVLPFTNLSAGGDDQYFSDGLAEELINALSRLSGLRVASRTSSFRYRDRDADARQIGRELGVDALLEGSVRRSGTRVRITVQLVDTAEGYHAWSDRYDRELADVFDVQDEIVSAIVGALVPALAGEAGGLVRRPTENLQAYDLYLRGRHYWNQRSPAVVGTAIGYFEEALALDPGYALAYCGLADCYSILRVYGLTPLEHSQPRALSAVTRALALDPELPEAYFSRALYTFHFERRWRQAAPDFEQAVVRSPRNGMFEAYAGLFCATGYEEDRARQHLERAEALDPHSSVVQFLLACTECAMRDPRAAERHARRALELAPESLGPRWPMTVALLMDGRADEALAAGEEVIARTRAPVYLGVLAMVYGCAGRIADVKQLAEELDDRQGRGEYISPAARLSLQLGLKDPEGVRTALAACADGGAAPFSVIATGRWLLEGYRAHPDIDALMDRLHDGARPGGAP